MRALGDSGARPETSHLPPFVGLQSAACHHEHTRFNARDVNEVSDESTHPRTGIAARACMRHDALDMFCSATSWLPDGAREVFILRKVE